MKTAAPANGEKTLTEPQTREYWCFISYRHADNKEPGRQWASWLHHSLETYEVPPDLVGQRNEHGDVIPERIFPVFRDEADAAASDDLSREIANALSHSRFLLVLCSPHAVISHYVAQEIIAFKRASPHHAKRIRAAIIAGDPGGIEVTAIDEVSEVAYHRRQCLPRALRFKVNPDGHVTDHPAEPLSADFRLPDGLESFTTPAALREELKKSGRLRRAKINSAVNEHAERTELMKLKIIAGILGVPLVRLTDRDKAYQLVKQAAEAQRRQRQLIISAIFVTAILLLLAVAGMQNAKTKAVQSERTKTEIANARLAHQKGSDLANSGEPARGILWLAKSLQTCPESAKDLQGIIRTDLASRLLMLHRLERAFSTSGAFAVVGFRPSGKPLLFGAEGGKLKDMTTGGFVGDFPIQFKISARALSPDGRLFAVSSLEGDTIIANVSDGKFVAKTLTHQGEVRFLAFSPDAAQLLVVATPDTSDNPKPYVAMKAYEAGALNPTDVAFSCKDVLNYAAYSKDGRYVATAGQDGNARLWVAATGAAFGPPLPHPGAVFSIAFSPAGDSVVTGCLDGGVRLWKLAAGETSPVQPFFTVKHQGPVRSVSFSHHGRYLLSSSEDGTTRLWDSLTGRMFGQPMLDTQQARSAVFSPDDEHILTGGNSWTARLWRVTPEEALARTLPAQGAVEAIVFSPDGKLALTGCQGSDSHAGTGQIWEVGSGRAHGAELEQGGQVRCVAFSADGSLAATAGNDGHVNLWKTSDGSRAQEPWAYNGVLAAVAFSPDNRWIAMAGRGNQVMLREVRSEKETRHWNAYPDKGRYVNSLTFSPDSRWLLAGGSFSAKIFSIPEGTPRSQSMLHTGELNRAVLSPDGKMILTCGKESKAGLCSASDGNPLGPLMEHNGEVLDGAFAPDGRIVATASADGNVRLWSVPGAQTLMPPLVHGGWVRCVAFSPDGEVLATGCDDGLARLWRTKDGAPLGAELYHRGAVTRIMFSPDGRTILTASRDGTARLWTPPRPIQGNPEEIKRKVEDWTGMEMMDDETVRILSPETWAQQHPRSAGN